MSTLTDMLADLVALFKESREMGGSPVACALSAFSFWALSFVGTPIGELYLGASRKEL
jgi:hypothetical protein